MKGNFKVRCIRGYHGYTASGKVYEVVNGKLTYDNGRKCFGDYYSVEKLNKNMQSQFELVTDNKEITIRQKGRKVIAVMTEDGKYVKSAKAKCSPTDVYDFEVGAKLAFSRLMGEDTSIREVKRPAKVGEWIRVTSESGHDNGKGIFEVTGLGPNNDGWVYVNGQTRNIIRIDQYVVLENYQPEETAKILADYTDKELINELSRRWEDKQ